MKRGKEETSSVWCTQCSTNMMANEMAVVNHFKRAHNRTPTNKEIKKVLSNTYPTKVNTPKCKEENALSAQNIKNKKKKKKKKKIELITKRGSTSYGVYTCSSCKKRVHNPTKYAKSTIGTVYLCAPCKDRIRFRSFGQKRSDALDIAVSGGAFEGSRRRH